MKRVSILVLLGLVAACGGAESSESRSGTGGVGGQNGSGGVPIPTEVDQLCRDFCANEAEGEDCGVSTCSRFISGCGSGSSVQQCYESCLVEYSNRLGSPVCPRGARACFPRPICPEEWVDWVDCRVNQYECNDLFGDCDDVEPQGPCPYSTADMERWCADNCAQAYNQCVNAEGACLLPESLSCDTLTNPPVDCGKFCTSDSECEGSFCRGACDAVCTPDEGCDANAICDSNTGRCIPVFN